MSPFLFHFSAALDCILDARVSFSIFIFFHLNFSLAHVNSIKHDQIDWVECQKVPRLWGWIVSLMEKDKMTGQESAVKRETRRVSFTNQRGGGRTVCISKRETDHVHSWRIFLSNFRRVDEFIRCEIASKLCIITFSAANIALPFVAAKTSFVNYDRCVNGEKCFCVRGSMRNTVKRNVESIAILEIINVIYLSLFYIYKT